MSQTSNKRNQKSVVEGRRKRRKEKGPRPTPVQHREKFGYHKITLTNNQKIVRDLIDCNRIVFLEGSAGTGKTMTVLHTFINQYLQDQTKTIKVIRTPVEAGDDRIGFLEGKKAEKCEPHFASAKKILEELLSKQKVEADLNKRIFFDIPNFVLGETFDNCLVFIDEAQQLSPKILKLLLERTGKNSTVVVAGDPSQLYAGGRRNALTDAKKRFFTIMPTGEALSKYQGIVHYAFKVDDVMRDEIVKSVIRAYSEER